MSEPTDAHGGIDYLATATRVTTYAGCAEAYLENDLHIFLFADAAPYNEGVLPWVEGDMHRAERKLSNRLFSRAALTVYERDLLTPTIERCLAEIAVKRDASGVARADLVEIASLALITISATVIGLDGVEDLERARKLLEAHDIMTLAINGRWSTRPFEEIEREAQVMKRQFIADYFIPARDRRERLLAQIEAGEVSAEEEPLDLITLMLSAPEPEWDEDLPARACILFLSASVTSTASSIVHLVDDLMTWLDAHPEDRALLDDDTFLRGAINESLRLHAATPAQVRQASRDLTLPSGRQVAEGDVLALMTTEANRDPSVFGPDVDAFDPRRYQRLPHGVPPYGLVFGYGRHVCVGKPLVTTATESGRSVDSFDLQRTNMRVLRALLSVGIQRDPERPPVPADSHQERYASYPVRFSQLPVAVA